MLAASTVSERLGRMTAEAQDALRELLTTHSAIHHEPTRTWDGHTEMTPWGPRRRGGVISVGYSFWKALSPAGVQAQALALEKYRTVEAITRILLKGQPQKVLDTFEKNR